MIIINYCNFFYIFGEKTHLSFSTNEQVFQIFNKKKKNLRKEKGKAFFIINEHTLKVSNHLPAKIDIL